MKKNDKRVTNLLKNTVIISVGKVCTQLVGFLLLPLYTAVLSKADYGIVDLLNTYVMLIAPLVIFQVEQALFRELLDKRAHDKQMQKIVSTVVFFVIIQLLLFSCLVFVITRFVTIVYWQYIVFNVTSTIMLNVFLQVARGVGENGVYAFASFLVASSTIVCNVITIVPLSMGAKGMLLSMLIGNCVGITYLLFSLGVFRLVKMKSFSKRILKECLRYSFPLIPDALSWWVVAASDRTIISYFCGIEANGIVSVSQKFSGIFIAAYNIFHLSWTEQVGLHIKDVDCESFLSEMVEKILNFFYAVCLLTISVMPFLFDVLVNKAYGSSYGLIPLYMTSAFLCVGAGLYGGLYIGLKDTKGMAKTTAIAAITNIAVCLAMINVIDFYSAALSSVVAYMVVFVCRYRNVNKTLSIKIKAKMVGGYVALLFMEMITFYSGIHVLQLVSAFVSLVFCVLINKSVLIMFVKTLMAKIKRGEKK